MLDQRVRRSIDHERSFADVDALITGLTSGTLYFERSLDSTTGTDGNWTSASVRQAGLTVGDLAISSTTNGEFRGVAAGAKWICVRSVGALTGTPAITIRLSDATGGVFISHSLPSGSNVLGGVTQSGAPLLGPG